MKNCPFCKKPITQNNDTCPHCKQVLIERIYPKVISHTNKDTANKQPQHFKEFKNKFKNIEWNNFKKYIPILALLLLIIFISNQKGENNISHKPVSVIPKSENTSAELSDIPEIQNRTSKTYISLDNGTMLYGNPYYFKGYGELKIDNGTSLDAIAKLVNVTTNKSISTVYIKANSDYTISKISNGDYKLFFNLGNDWDTEIKAFAVNSSYEVFQETFDFTTSKYEEDEYIRTKYATFSVTLNPIIGGHAKTNEINAMDFSRF